MALAEEQLRSRREEQEKKNNAGSVRQVGSKSPLFGSPHGPRPTIVPRGPHFPYAVKIRDV